MTRAMASARRPLHGEPVERHMIQHVERVAGPAQEIVDAQEHEGAAVLGCARGELRGRATACG